LEIKPSDGEPNIDGLPISKGPTVQTAIKPGQVAYIAMRKALNAPQLATALEKQKIPALSKTGCTGRLGQSVCGFICRFAFP